MTARQAHADVPRARCDQADKAWLQEDHRGMEMLTGALAIGVLILLGVLMGIAGADWWTQAGYVVDLVNWIRGRA